MIKYLIYTIVLLLLVPFVAYSGEFGIVDLELSEMLNDDWVLEGEIAKYAKHPVSFDLIFFLSDKGCIDSLQFDSADGYEYIESVMGSLKSIDFSPSIYLGRKIPVTLPAKLEFAFIKYKSKAILKLPYNNKTGRFNRELVDKVFKYNKFSPAIVNTVPSYFCSLNSNFNFADYPFAVYKVELNSFGQVIDLQTIFSSYDHFSNIFYNILLYTDFEPARFDNGKIKSNIFVTVRFFQKLAYPIEEWPPSYDKEIDYSFEYHRISFRPYLDSIVNPPFPINMPTGGFIQENKMPYNDTVNVKVTVDIRGKIRHPIYISSYYPQSYSIAKSILKKLSYLPARNINGKKVEYEGQLSLILRSNSNNIRIITNWLRE